MNLLLITFIWPFLGLVLSLKHWRHPMAMNAFWLWCCYFGAILIYHPFGSILGDGCDAGRYYLGFLETYIADPSLGSILSSYLQTENTLDMYKPLMEYLICKISINGHFMFFCYAIVFGFFYSRNVWYVLELLRKQSSKIHYFWIAAILLEVPIWKIGGARFCTAFHIFIYGLLPYLYEGNKRSLFCCAITPLFHFSFLYIALITILYSFIPKTILSKQTIATSILVFFIATSFVNTLDLASVSSNLSSVSPDAFEGRIEQYSNEDTKNRNIQASASNNWYVSGAGKIATIASIILVLFIYSNCSRTQHYNYNLYNTLLYCLFISGIANIFALVPSGGRFIHVSNTVRCFFIIFSFTTLDMSDKQNRVHRIAGWCSLLAIIVGIRMGLEYCGYNLIFGNFFTVLFLETDYPIIYFIKSFI